MTTIQILIRFIIHSTHLQCAACRQRDISLDEDPNGIVVVCPWENSDSLPKLSQASRDHKDPVILTITSQNCPDLVGRYFLNNKPFFQSSRRSFVFALVSCIVLMYMTEFLNNFDSVSNTGTETCKNMAFYVIMAFILAAVGHTSIQQLPEPILAPLDHNFVDWKAALKALITTAIIHSLWVSFPLLETVVSFTVPLACTSVVALSSVDTSKTSETLKEGPKTKQDIQDTSPEEEQRMQYFHTFIYSSSRIKRLDLRILTMGILIGLVDIVHSSEEDVWPTGAIVSTLTTLIFLFLENLVLPSREIQQLVISISTTALVGIYSTFNFINMFSTCEDDADTYDCNAQPMLCSLWYTVLILMMVADRSMDQTTTTDNSPLQTRNAIYISVNINKPYCRFRWQLKYLPFNAVLFWAFVSHIFRSSWPLDTRSTLISLAIFLCVVGSQPLPSPSSQIIIPEETSRRRNSVRHVLALAFCIAATALAVSLDYHEILPLGSESEGGEKWEEIVSWMPFGSHSLFLLVWRCLEGMRACFWKKGKEDGGLIVEEKLLDAESGMNTEGAQSQENCV